MPLQAVLRAFSHVLRECFIATGLNGHLTTHSLRKNFAQRLYDRTGDIFAVQEMLGHKAVSTTQKYLGVNYANIKEAVEQMAVSGELHITPHFGESNSSGEF